MRCLAALPLALLCLLLLPPSPVLADAETLAAARRGDPAALPRLGKLAVDNSQPTALRATALTLAAGYGADAWTLLAGALYDPSPKIRLAAVRGLQGLPPDGRVRFLARLLDDPSAEVRDATAVALVSVPAALLTPEQTATLTAALQAYRTRLAARTDRPETQMALAELALASGDGTAAEAAYRAAIAQDAEFLPARLQLAALQDNGGRPWDAEATLRATLEVAPDSGEAHHAYGLLLASSDRLEEEIGHLRRAVALLPEDAGLRYNLALAQQAAGQGAAARATLDAAHALAPWDPDILQVQAVFTARAGDWDAAEGHAEALVALYPEAPGPKLLLERIRARQRL